METIATSEVEAAVSSVDAAEGKGIENVPEESEQEISAQTGSKGIMHRANLSQRKVILLQDVPVSTN